ncbi:similar to Saccharomyces cerevisiae YER033C ZRG8 Protein of unknown function [Maudiozyma saulgeensis]|uniref:Zinc-regulated protein 8 n=1 Tax=Maudiozyma saulgeensis TaxID=1789683 RepID=A0A1X7R4C9_9SACH|nr:similar to Saccharomyces cerevisiae YER033C ZRG8 Protein of unknown function [Kazachstania saulgeensis]
MRSFIKAHRKSNSLDRSKTNEPISGNNTSYISTKSSLTNNDTVNTTKILNDRRASDIIPRVSLNAREGSNSDSIDFTPTTPHKSNSSQERGSPSIASPSFESFHKFASKTKLTSKLFNKNAPSNIPQGLQAQEQPFTTSNSTSASSSPTKKPRSTFEILPTIKGTITHSWGYHHGSSPIINLNNNYEDQGSNSDRRFSSESWDPTFMTSPTTNYLFEKEQGQTQGKKNQNIDKGAIVLEKTETCDTELDPAFKISRSSQFSNIHNDSPQPIEKSPTNEIMDADRVIIRPDKNQSVDTLQSTESERHGNISRNKVKNKNRKITIHSSGDLLTLQKNSKSFENSPLAIPSIPKFVIQEPISKIVPENYDNGSDGNHSKASKDTNHLTFDTDSDSDESKFSFEYSTINGRTSSVKYYKTPGETEEEEVEHLESKLSVYMDDMYDDEGLDDDMNYIDDSYDHSSDNNNHEHFDISNEKTQIKQSKTVQKYDDLFDLSDEQDDSIDNNVEGNSSLHSQKDKITESTILNEVEDFNPHKSINTQNNSNATSNKTKLSVTKYNDLFDISDDSSNSTYSPENLHTHELKLTTSNKKGKSKPIMKYNDLFDISDSDNDSADEIYPESINDTRQYYKRDDALNTEISTSTSNRLKLDNSKLPFLGIDIPNAKNHKLPVLNENTRSVDFTSPPHHDSLYTSSPNNSKIPKILLSPIDNDTRTDLTVDLKTPKERLLKFSPLTFTLNESSPIQPHLPPPARSQALKFHDLNSNMDSEIPGLTSNLFFIDEAEEDEYNTNLKIHDIGTENTSQHEGEESYSDYLDEINTVPEDFEFSDSDEYQLETFSGKHLGKVSHLSLRKSPLGGRESFRRTHSYHSKPLSISRENSPMKNKLELDNKTVTFFSSSWEDVNDNKEPCRVSSFKRKSDNISPSPVIPENGEENTSTFFEPSPSYVRSSTYSLSPIQESASNNSAPGSPKMKQHNI